MILFTILAIEFVIWQSADITVSIESESADVDKNTFAISIQNTAGSTLLFYESGEAGGVIEFLGSDGEWKEFCEVCYRDGNEMPVKQKHDGMFSELEPGAEWRINVPEEKVAQMKDGGTYRIKMTYLTQKKYDRYIDYIDRESSPSESADSVTDSSEIAEESDISIPALSEDAEIDSSAESEPLEEMYFGQSVSETFIKTFVYNRPVTTVSSISIAESDISHDISEPIRNMDILSANKNKSIVK